MYPAEIVSYDGQRRRVRIRAIGLTEGDSLLPEAELMYSLGDNAKKTEIEINAGDLVWIDFIANDHRYPVILGFRNAETGNSVGWRKWHHDNIEIVAAGTLKLKCAQLVIETDSTTHSGTLAISDAVQMAASLAVAGTLSNDGVNVGKDHKHDENGDGGGETDGPH
jgi:phage baseplate assembly protein gpV